MHVEVCSEGGTQNRNMSSSQDSLSLAIELNAKGMMNLAIACTLIQRQSNLEATIAGTFAQHDLYNWV